MRAILEAEQQRAGRVPPQPSGRIGVAADLFVRSRRRYPASTSSFFLDLDPQDPFAYVIVIMVYRT